jgi:hypothetical protein
LTKKNAGGQSAKLGKGGRYMDTLFDTLIRRLALMSALVGDVARDEMLAQHINGTLNLDTMSEADFKKQLDDFRQQRGVSSTKTLRIGPSIEAIAMICLPGKFRDRCEAATALRDSLKQSTESPIDISGQDLDALIGVAEAWEPIKVSNTGKSLSEIWAINLKYLDKMHKSGFFPAPAANSEDVFDWMKMAGWASVETVLDARGRKTLLVANPNERFADVMKSIVNGKPAKMADLTEMQVAAKAKTAHAKKSVSRPVTGVTISREPWELITTEDAAEPIIDINNIDLKKED